MNLITSPDGNNAIITTLSHVRKHPNADRLQLATVFGTTVIVDLAAKNGDMVVYFDSNLRLSKEYLQFNNLFSNKELNSDTTQYGYFGSNGKVKAQRFRGELSNGYVAPLESLNIPDMGFTYDGELTDKLLPGTEFTHINGVEICRKYVIPSNMPGKPGSRNRPKKRIDLTKMFHRHWDTKQFMKLVHEIPSGMIYIEEKVHGTSGRTGRIKVKTNRPWYKFWLPKEEWIVVSGTRKMDSITGHIHQVRQEVHDRLVPHLRKGETLYYEIFGTDHTGKEIQKGFSYGCKAGEYKVMLYRVTMTNEDGFSVDLSRQAVYNRADELGLMKPYLLYPFVVNTITFNLPLLIEESVEGNSSFDSNTICEGVVVWFMDTYGNWTCLKHKNPEFLLLESKQRDEGIGDAEDLDYEPAN